MENKDIKNILDSIIESVQDDDQELLIETVEHIPEELWRDLDASTQIMETFLKWVGSDFFVYPKEFIPKFFWDNKDLVYSYARLLCQFYKEEQIDYNFTELIPAKVLKDKDFTIMFLSCNYYEVVDYVPKEFWGDQSVVFASLEGLENHIEYRVNTPMLIPPDKTECIGYLFKKVSKDLSNNKDFIIGFLSNYYFIETFEVVYKWIDKSLWLDKNFVKKVLDIDCELSDEYLKEVMKDEEFEEWFNERYGT